MFDKSSFPDQDLLSLCAILRWFDHDLLQALTDHDKSTIAALFASHFITAMPDGGYCLNEEGRAACEMNPDLELELHTRVFETFLQRMKQPFAASRRFVDEEACLYHLDQLFFILNPRDAWQTIAQHVSAVRQAAPQQACHQQLLALIDGYVLLYTYHYERAEGIFSTLLSHSDLQPNTRIRVLNGLALLNTYQTRYDQALQWYQQMYQLARHDDNLRYQGTALINMGMVYNDLGDYDQALDLTQQSWQIFRQLKDPLREVYALYEIGHNALRLGRWLVAEERLQEAATLAQAQGVTARLGYIYWAQGLLYHMLGDTSQSKAVYQRSLAIVQSPEHNDLKQANDIWWHLGFLYYTQGQSDKALAAYEQAITLAQSLGRTYWLSLIYYQCGNLFRRQGRFDETRNAYEQAIQHLETLRGATKGEEVKIRLLGRPQQLYEAMVLLCLEEKRFVEAFNYVERARSRAFLDQLREKDPTLYETLVQPVVTLNEVQAQLPEGTLLLEFFTIGVIPRGENMINKLPPENTRLREYLTHPPHLLLFVVTRDHFELRRLNLDPNVLQPRVGASSPIRRFLRPRQLSKLYARLIEPIEPLLRQHKQLYLIPHGPLHYVPWMALRSSKGHYLLDQDGPAIALAPSATILLRNCLSKPARQDGGFLALGYNDEGKDALQYAEVEARFLARQLNGQAWVGAQAKSERLIAYNQPLRWLHISTHGVFDPHSPLDSKLRLGLHDAPNVRTIMRDLSLSVNIVTLSACTSGLTHIVPGDELLGLPRAFLYAGAPTVVCAPWEAADLVALLVMEHFYTDLQQDHSPAAALRNAQVAVRTMTGQDLISTLARWRESYPDETDSLSLKLPIILPHQLDSAIFADPTYWALFMLIGRAD